jgi:hypothetical protein
VKDKCHRRISSTSMKIASSILRTFQKAVFLSLFTAIGIVTLSTVQCSNTNNAVTTTNPGTEKKSLGGAIMVFMDNLEMADSSKTYVSVASNDVKAYIYCHCGEDSCKTSDMTSGRVDPVLKFFPGCPLMLTENMDVCNGQANGSRIKLQRVNIKDGERPIILKLLQNQSALIFRFASFWSHSLS